MGGCINGFSVLTQFVIELLLRASICFSQVAQQIE